MSAQTKSTLTLVLVVAAIAAAVTWWMLRPAGLPVGIVSGNGLIEATEIDIAYLDVGKLSNATIRVVYRQFSC